MVSEQQQRLHRYAPYYYVPYICHIPARAFYGYLRISDTFSSDAFSCAVPERSLGVPCASLRV